MNQLKVLVIDDDSITCDLLETILQMENYQTASRYALSKADIAPLLDHEKPHLLVLDLNLGSQETLDFVSEIKREARWQDLLILMTSAINRRQECLAAGANEFILKPFSWQQITQVVKNLMPQTH